MEPNWLKLEPTLLFEIRSFLLNGPKRIFLYFENLEHNARIRLVEINFSQNKIWIFNRNGRSSNVFVNLGRIRKKTTKFNFHRKKIFEKKILQLMDLRGFCMLYLI